MDSRNPSFRHVLSLVAGVSLSGLLISGCSSSAKQPEQPSLKPVDLFNGAVQLPPEPNSLLRNGDKVTWLVVWQDQQKKRHLLRFDALCSEDKGWMFYQAEKGMKPFSEQASDLSLPPEPLRQLRDSKALRSACAQTTPDDWRIVDQHDEEDWLIIDRNNIQTTANTRRLWLGHDYLHERAGVGNETTTTQIRARVEIDCAQRTLRYLSLFNMTPDNQMSTGRASTSGEEGDIPQANEPALLKAGCLSDAELSRLPKLQSRPKLEAVIAPPKLAKAPLEAIKALNLPSPTERLAQINFSYFAAVADRATFYEHRTWRLQTDSASGQILVRPSSSTQAPQLNLSFLGLFKLGTTYLLDDEPSKRMTLENLKFEGDWQNLPSGSQVSYTQIFTGGQYPENGDFTLTMDCKVGPTKPASDIHPELKGTANLIRCGKPKSPVERSNYYWYLRHYGQFLPLADDFVFMKWVWKVDSFKVAQ